MRQAKVYMGNKLAGMLTEDEEGYHFQYHTDYLNESDVRPVSLTLPLQNSPMKSKTMFPFFDGLIPEGWLLEIAENNWKLNERDRMGLLMVCCVDCIGAVSIEGVKTSE
jgi:serine/threonine-protein kinase HipA